MLKKAFIIALIALLAVQASGCFGESPPPASREALASLDAAILKYDAALGPYTNGDYTGARTEYSACVDLFNGCHATFDRIAQSDRPPLEKVIAGNLASASEKFAYASAYMRDSCKNALSSGNNVYLLKATADEYDLAARSLYTTNKAELEKFLRSQPSPQ